MTYPKTLSQRWRAGGLEEKTGMDPRVLFWAFLKPFLNGIIGIVLMLINYFGLSLIAGFFGYDFQKLFSNILFYIALGLAWVIFTFKSSLIDGSLNLLSSFFALNFALGLILTPYLSYILWTSIGWKYLCFWLICLASLTLNLLMTPEK